MRTLNLFSNLLLSTVLASCSGMSYKKTVGHVDRARFMGDWYVIAGRFTFLEKDAYNAVERYHWNQKEQRIDVSYEYNKGSLTGKKKTIPQKAWIVDQDSNARWKVSPLWPLKFSYLVIALDQDYQWTAIGVPDQDYLWIMARDPHFSREQMQMVLNELQREGYRTDELVYVEHTR